MSGRTLTLTQWSRGVPLTRRQMKCASRRLVVSPVQPGGTRREVLGSDGLPGSERVKGTRACQESSGLTQAYGLGVLRDPRNMVKAGLPEAQSPDDASRHPPERRLNRCRALCWYSGFADATFGARSDAL